jgi:hypothetical protein
VPSLLIEESELSELPDLVRSQLDRHEPVIAATVGAMTGSRQPA